MEELYRNGELREDKYVEATLVLDSIYRDILSRMSSQEVRAEAERTVKDLEIQGLGKEEIESLLSETVSNFLRDHPELTFIDRYNLLNRILKSRGIDFSDALVEIRKTLVVGEDIGVKKEQLLSLRERLGLDIDTWNLILQEFRILLERETARKQPTQVINIDVPIEPDVTKLSTDELVTVVSDVYVEGQADLARAVSDKDTQRIVQIKIKLGELVTTGKITDKDEYARALDALEELDKRIIKIRLQRGPKERTAVIAELRGRGEFNKLVEIFRETFPFEIYPELASELGEATQVDKDSLANFFVEQAKKSTEEMRVYGKVPKQGQVVARVYKTKRKAEGWKRERYQEGYPIVIIGEVYDKDGRALPVEEVESLYGLEVQKGEDGKPLQLIIRVGGGRMVYIDQEMTVVADDKGNIKSTHFGKLEREEIPGLEATDKVLYGSALEVKGAGTSRFSGVTFESVTVNKERFLEIFNQKAVEGKWTDDTKAMVLEKIDKKGERKQGGYITEDFYVRKIGEDEYIVITAKDVRDEFSGKTVGIFKDFRYQAGPVGAPGLALIDSEWLARGNQRILIENGAALNVVIVDMVTLDKKIDPETGKAKIDGNGQIYRVTLGGRERTDVVDFVKTPRDLANIRRAFGAEWKDKSMVTMFRNFGKNTRAFLLTNLVFYLESLRIGKDVDLEGNIADLGEFLKVKEGFEDKDKQILITKWADYLNKVHRAFEGPMYTDRSVSPYFREYLLELFGGNEKYVDQVIEELQRRALFYGENDLTFNEQAAEVAETVYSYWKLYLEETGGKRIEEAPVESTGGFPISRGPGAQRIDQQTLDKIEELVGGNKFSEAEALLDPTEAQRQGFDPVLEGDREDLRTWIGGKKIISESDPEHVGSLQEAKAEPFLTLGNIELISGGIGGYPQHVVGIKAVAVFNPDGTVDEIFFFWPLDSHKDVAREAGYILDKRAGRKYGTYPKDFLEDAGIQIQYDTINKEIIGIQMSSQISEAAKDSEQKYTREQMDNLRGELERRISFEIPELETVYEGYELEGEEIAIPVGE